MTICWPPPAAIPHPIDKRDYITPSPTTRGQICVISDSRECCIVSAARHSRGGSPTSARTNDVQCCLGAAWECRQSDGVSDVESTRYRRQLSPGARPAPPTLPRLPSLFSRQRTLALLMQSGIQLTRCGAGRGARRSTRRGTDNRRWRCVVRKTLPTQQSVSSLEAGWQWY